MKTHSVIEFYHLPGFMSEESASIPFSGNLDECSAFINKENKMNQIFGYSSEYRFECLESEEAEAKCLAANELKQKVIAEFRLKVYGEPILV